jgi:hypothetical protein
VMILLGGEWVLENENDGVAAQEHLADVAILVHRFGLLLAFAGSRELGPHFFDAFKDHVAVAVEGLDTAQQLLVVSAVDQDLSVVLHRVRQDGKGSGVELLLFDLLQFFRRHFGSGFGRRHRDADLTKVLGALSKR